MQNRQKDEIVTDILISANGGATISKIMFRAYLSHGQAKVYLGELVGCDLLEYDSFIKQYRTTAKGLNYLCAVDLMSEMLSVETKRSSMKSTEGFQF